MGYSCDKHGPIPERNFCSICYTIKPEVDWPHVERIKRLMYIGDIYRIDADDIDFLIDTIEHS